MAVTAPRRSWTESGTVSVAATLATTTPAPPTRMPSTSVRSYPAAIPNSVAMMTPSGVSARRMATMSASSLRRSSSVRAIVYSRWPMTVSPASVSPPAMASSDMTVTYWPTAIGPR